MGRLQKKKTPRNKKKKAEASVKSVSGLQKSAVSSKPDAKSVKKQKTPTVRKPVKVKKSASAQQSTNIFNKSTQFLREVIIELKKVTWPGRKQTIGSTVVVIILVTIIAFFLGAVDIGLSQLVRVILQ